MFDKLKLEGKAALLLIQNKVGDSKGDYDKVSGDYDTFFSKEMGEYSRDVVRKMGIKADENVLELACGTGHITVEIAKFVKDKGCINIVDQSEGMLNIAKGKIAKLSSAKINIHKGDMVEYLKGVPSDSVDSIVCGWAICYVEPVKLFKEMLRVLKKGGKVGIIETRSDSEKLMMDVFEKLLIQDRTLLKKYISLKLPNNKGNLERWFEKAGLKPKECWEGEKILKCEKPEDAIEWVESSGAAAGFMDVMDLSRKDEIELKAKEILEKDFFAKGNKKLSHTFVSGIAVKE